MNSYWTSNGATWHVDPPIFKPEHWERQLEQEENQLERMKSSLQRRKSKHKRILLMGRISNCEARIACSNRHNPLIFGYNSIYHDPPTVWCATREEAEAVWMMEWLLTR